MMKVHSMKDSTDFNRDAILDIFLASFCQDPFTRWLFPDIHSYIMNFPRYAEAFGGLAFECETVVFGEGNKGAVLLLPPNVHSDEQKLTALISKEIDDAIQDDVAATFKLRESYLPDNPHWYIPVIGIDPFYQGKGYGSALLEYVFNEMLKNNETVYLESANKRNLSFYERHGFEVLAEIQSGSSPTIYPMVREASQPATVRIARK